MEAVHDSPAWRDERNARLARWVGDANAVAWLLDLWDAYEVVDDLVDRDKPVSETDVFRMLWELAVDAPANPFFLKHHRELLPVMRLGINHWIDSVVLEKDGTDRSLRFSYVLRGAYMSITQTVIEITRGRDAMRATSREIIEFFGSETYEDYASKIRAANNAKAA